MKERKENNLKRLLKIITITFLCSSPFFDTIFFYNRITSLIRCIIIVILFIFTIFLYKESRKISKYVFICYIFSFLYLIINYYHSKTFYSLVPGNFHYSFLSESMVIIKLMMPITLVFSLYYQKLSKKDFFLIFKSWILIICLSIIITNIFKVSYSSYADTKIMYNIFEWNKQRYYSLTASKGFFAYANQIASYLVLLLVFSIYYYIKENKSGILYIFLIAICSLMLGTRVSSFGTLLVYVLVLLIYLFYVLIKKEKFNKSFLFLLLPIIVWLVIIPISPYYNRNLELKKYENNEAVPIINNTNNNDDNGEDYLEDNIYDDKISYFLENVNNDLIPPMFYNDIYPLKYDSTFWYNFIISIPESQINYRLIEKSIIKRIIEINNNKLDILFGISISRIQNVVNVERDFLLHYYAFGIVGFVILLFDYIFFFFYIIYLFIKQKKFTNFLLLLSVCLFLFIAYISGNIINSLSTIILFSTLIGVAIKNINTSCYN